MKLKLDMVSIFQNVSGLLNRLSESNVESITGEMSTVFLVRCHFNYILVCFSLLFYIISFCNLIGGMMETIVVVDLLLNAITT